MPWYMDPSTACVDCRRGDGYPNDVEQFHRRHQWIVGDYLVSPHKYHTPGTLKDGIECCESHYWGVPVIREHP